jgi:hypothetical protein
MFNYRNIVFIILFLITLPALFSQDNDSASISKYEQTIRGLFKKILESDNDSKKEKINNEIIKKLEQVLAIEGSFSYPFDSLRNIGRIISKDNKLRIYTWNLPYNDGTHRYYGFIQYYPPKEKKFLLFKLTDCSDDYQSPESMILTDSSWFGALYYEIIEMKYQEVAYYVLLGFDFNNLLTTKKIIEVLYFKDDKVPVFGKPVFFYGDKLCNRIIFEYSSRVSMGLKYNKDLKMIIYDHLSPSKPSFEGHFMYYGPDFSYDGLEFKDGVWKEVRDVDVRNPAY